MRPSIGPCRGMLEFAYFPGFEGQHDWQFDQEAENARGEKIPHADRHKKPDGPAVRRSRLAFGATFSALKVITLLLLTLEAWSFVKSGEQKTLDRYHLHRGCVRG